MGSVAKRKCARGPRCAGCDPQTEQPAKLSDFNKGDLCNLCERQHGGAVVATAGGPRWLAATTQAVETVLSGKASLWDLLELDPTNGGYGWKSDRGKVLMLLDSETLYGVSDWLEEHITEALERDEHGRYAGLCRDVRTVAWLASLSPDRPLFPAQRDDTSPFQFVGYYMGGGRRKDMTKVVQLERLRRAPHHYSERDLATALDIPRTTLQKMIQRMEEIGFSSAKFTPDDLAFAAFGRLRGREHRPDPF